MSRSAYKVLGPDRRSYHGGSGTWPAPGMWLEVKGALEPCSNGLHLCAREHLLSWLGPAIWEAEYEGECIDHDDKLVVRRARLVRQVEAWNDSTARLFAADCAERALPIFEAHRPGDARPREAIAAARAFARAEIPAAAMDAAWAAAMDAASAAARAASAAAWAAASSAARAASAAASSAARDAAWAAARAAAWDAARDAAMDAAWAAARDAARAAARDAARDAAMDAERAWHTERLFQYLEGEIR